MKNNWINKGFVGIEVTSSEIVCVFLRQPHRGEIVIEKQATFFRGLSPALSSAQQKGAHLLEAKFLKRFCKGSSYQVMSIPYSHCGMSRHHFSDELTEAEIEFELQSMFPLESRFDFGRYDTATGDERQYWVMMAKQCDIEERVQVMKKASLRLNGIDVDAYAILRAVKAHVGSLFEGVTALVHGSATRLQLYVFKKNYLIYGRTEIFDDETLKVVLQRLLQFFDASPAREPIHQLVVTGLSMHQSERLHQEAWGFEMVDVDPLSTFKSSVTVNQNKISYVVALGLALKGVL